MPAPVTMLPQRQIDPLGMMLLNQIGQERQKTLLQGDMEKLSDWVKFNQIMQMSRMDSPPVSEMGPAEGLLPGEAMSVPPELVASVDTGAPSGLTALPKLRSDMGQQLGMSLLRGQLQNLMPLDPMTQSEIAKNQAMAQNYRANALSTLNPEPKSYEPVLLANDKGEQVQWTPGTAIPPGGPWKRTGTESQAQPKMELIEPMQGGQQRWLQQGEAIPEGYRVVRTPASVTTVNMNQGLERATRNKIESELVDLNKNIAQLEEADKLAKPEYFETPYKWGNKLTTLQEKGGGWLGRPSEGQKQSVRDRQKFLSTSQRNFLIFRKFITGVAGGMQEFQEIAKAQPNPDVDSYSQYMGKYQSARGTALMLQGLLRDMRDKGIPLTEINVQQEIRNRGLAPVNRMSQGEAPVSITNDAEYDALPSGAMFMAPDGSMRRKP